MSPSMGQGAPAGRQRLVVIGNGMAGARAVEEILRGGRRFEITVFGEEAHGSYNRTLLSGVPGGAAEARSLFLQPLSWYVENEITLHAGERVTRIDREARRVTAGSGRRVPYDLLLIATGSRPVTPPIEGIRRPDGSPKAGVFALRTLDDSRRIARHAAGSRRAVVIGGGLLGLEAACGLRELGIDVQIVQQADRLLDRQLDAEGGETLRRAVERLGIRVRLSCRTSALEGDDCVRGARLEDGTPLPCDLVVLACGVRPNVELAQECGLSVERAIVVDDQLRTSDPAVFALGECAEHRGRVYEFVQPVWEQAQVLAEYLTGRNTGARYTGSRVAARLNAPGLDVVCLGPLGPALPGAPNGTLNGSLNGRARPDGGESTDESTDESPDESPDESADEIVQFSEPGQGVYQRLVLRGGVLVGAVLVGENPRVPYLTQLFDRGARVPRERAALLFDLDPRPGAAPLDVLPDDALVCHCNGVRRRDIRECARGGGASLHSVMRHTRAGTGCGSCVTLLRELVDRCVRAEAPAPEVAA